VGPLARTFDFVANAAPGVKEILPVGKLAFEVRERHRDRLVGDGDGPVKARAGAGDAGFLGGRTEAPHVEIGLVGFEGLLREEQGRN